MTNAAEVDVGDRSALAAVPRWMAGTAGLAAGIAALAAAELTAAVVGGARSPITSIGTAVIELTPPALKDLAIDVLGTADKPVLIASVLVAVAAAAAVVGLLAVRRLWWGVVGVVVLGLVGLAAAAADPSATGAGAWLPALAAIGVGAGALRWLVGVLHASVGTAPEDEATADGNGRRTFLRAAATLGVVALGAGALGRWLTGQTARSTAPATVPLPAPDVALPPVPAGTSLGIDGLTPFITPNDDFYRIDTALQIPVIDVNEWRLRVTGMVDNPVELTFADLLDHRIVEADITLACVSNEVGGDLVGNARWRGVRLADVLADARILSQADQLVGRAVDGFTTGAPLQTVLDGRESLIAIGMNGAPLPRVHGFPARLVVPGLYGYVSATKWLTELQLTTFDAFDAYWVPLGWAERAPIKTQSRIDVPRSLATVPAGRVAVAGVAWAQQRGIDRVEVKVDNGRWEQARLAEQFDIDTWRQWVYEWDATPGRHELRVRATDGTGQLQTGERVPPRPDGATGRHSIVVIVADN